ncbi:hypothetical protein CS0771_07730 [Catellatospora sp. IY07-71]|nr:hypothetical protein CS0771_07730 [Catellatospora sp. IY07-71]
MFGRQELDERYSGVSTAERYPLTPAEPLAQQETGQACTVQQAISASRAHHWNTTTTVLRTICDHLVGGRDER